MRWIGSFFLILLLATARAFAGVPEVNLKLSREGGEILFYNPSGKELLRLTGLGLPEQITAINEDTLAVFDRKTGGIVLLKKDGAIVRKVAVPERLLSAEVFGLSYKPDTLTLPAGHHGVFLIPLDGGEARNLTTSSPQVYITGAVQEDARTAIVTSTKSGPGGEIFYRLSEKGEEPIKFSVPEPNNKGHSPRLTSCPNEPGTFAAWDRSWHQAYQLKDADKGIEVVTSIARGSWPVITSFYCRSGQDWTMGKEDYSLSVNQNSRNLRISTLYPALSTTSFPDGTSAISYIYEPDVSWPESRKKLSLPNKTSANWWEISGSICGGIILGFAVSLLFRRLGKKNPPVIIDPAECDAPPIQNRRSIAALVAAFLVLICGIGLIYLGTPAEYYASKLQYLRLAGGLILTALSVWYIRYINRVGPAAPLFPPIHFEWGFLAPITVGLSGGAAVMLIKFLNKPYMTVLDTWLLLLGFVSAQLIYPPWKPAAKVKNCFKFEIIDLFLPCGVAVFTLFFRLADVPANMHFDFTYNALYGLYLMDGDLPGIWTPGFVPAPVIGTWPDILAMYLVGPGSLGFRLGAAIFGIIGLTGAFYLALALYNDRRIACCSALLLAGTIPFIHFNRLNTAGVTAGTAIWAFAAFLMALRTASPRWWLIFGFWTAHCFYVWPPSRVAPLALLITGIIYFIFRARSVSRQLVGPILAFSFFFLLISPLIPDWYRNVHLLFPRVQESMEAFNPNDGLNSSRLSSSFGHPLGKAASWLVSTSDNCTQGTKTPALNKPLAFLLLVGLAVLLSESFFVWGAVVPWMLCFFLFCGAFADNPPYYTRVLPTLYVATALISRGVFVIGGFLSRNRQVPENILYICVIAGLLYLGPVREFSRYYKFETGRTGNYGMFEMVAVGREMRKLAPRHELFFITTGRSDLSLDLAKRSGRLGELLPHIFDLRVSEIRDLNRVLPICTDKPAAFFVQSTREAEDFNTIKAVYPDARLRPIKGFKGEKLGAVVTVDTNCKKTPDNRSS